MIYDNLLTAFSDGTNLTARQNMQRAAFYAGRAFTRGCVGYVHAVGHTLGALYDIPHGLAMAVLLPHVMELYGPRVYPRLARLAKICGLEGQDDAQLAQSLLDWIRKSNREMGLGESFPQIRPEDIDQMVDWALREANPLYPVPEVWNRDMVRLLIQRVCAPQGQSPEA